MVLVLFGSPSILRCMRGGRRLLCAGLMCLLGLAFVPSATATAAEVSFGPGGWSWFQDPRAVTYTGEHTRTYVGYVTPAGDVMVSSYDHATKVVASFVLQAALQQDDHVSPALLVRRDGRITAFYARHSGTPFYTRTTVNPEDVTAWGPAQTIDTNTTGPYGFTYPNPLRLSAENRAYLFWRGGNLDPVYSTQAAGQEAWATAQSLIHVPNNAPGPASERPYVKYASDGQGTIHFAYTNAHPNENPDVNIYYGRIRNGRVEAADGADIAALGTPIAPRDADRVFDGAGPTWIHDVAVGADGRPVVVFASFPTSTSATDHVYHYARWNGSAWDVREIVAAGGSISPARSPLYSGGITLDQDDPTTVYLSRQVGDAWWVETWKTGDGGASWASRTLTPGSTVKNLRPLSPRGREPAGEMVLWMSGAYTTFNVFDTAVTAFVEAGTTAAQPPGSTPAPAPDPSGSTPAPTPDPPGSTPAPFEPVPQTRSTDERFARASVRSQTIRIGRRRGGRLTVRCRADRGDRCKLGGSLRRGSIRIASVAGFIRGARRSTVGVRLTTRGFRRVKRAGGLRVRVIVTSSSLSGRGAPVRGKVRLVLRK